MDDEESPSNAVRLSKQLPFSALLEELDTGVSKLLSLMHHNQNMDEVEQDELIRRYAALKVESWKIRKSRIEAIHIAWRESLKRSVFLLERFFSRFSVLYGEDFCGLNVHNACLHMTMYVPWSCFAFEDANAKTLQSVHGTGNVVKPGLRKEEILIYILKRNKPWPLIYNIK